MRKGKIKNLASGVIIDVTATTEHPDSHYGRAVWVDSEGVAYMECDCKVSNPFYNVIEDKEE